MIKATGYYKNVEFIKQKTDSVLFERAKKYYINHFASMNTGDIICFELNERFIDKEIKVFEELSNLNFIEFAFIDKKTVKVETLCKPKKILNKGLEMREKKRKKQAEKRFTVKEEQNSLIRIVKVSYPTYKREKGKTLFDKIAKGQGVQVENKVYFGKNYIFINKRGVKVKPINDLSRVSEDILNLLEEKTLKLKCSNN